MMSSDGDDCAALTQLISLNFDECEYEESEFVVSITDKNEETQNRVDDSEEKCHGEENSEVVKETMEFSDGVIVQLVETDSDQKDIDYSQYISKAQEEEKDYPEAVPRSLCSTVTMAYIPGDSLKGDDEEDDE